MKKSTRIHLPYKVLSFFMALLIISASLPLAFAASPIALSSSNVVSYPTVEGTIYYGQIIGDVLSLEGGEVQYNGVKVEGEFQFADPTKRQTSVSNALRADIVFVPSNQSEYTGFTESRSRNVTYPALRATPVLVDEDAPPTVEEIVKAGVTLSSITISGGNIKNPYNPEDTNTASATWAWLNPDTVVNESGNYEAVITARNHETLTHQIYITVESPIAVTEVSVLPKIEEFDFSAELKWSQIELSGGCVVVKNSDTVVDGEFSVTDLWKNSTPRAGSYEVDVIFTPNDTEKYTTVEAKVPVTVNKAPMKFVDENGNEIVPEITVPYGTKFNDVPRLLEKYVKGPDVIRVSVGDLEKETCTEGTFTCRVLAPNDSANYETTELTFKVVIEKKELNPKLAVAVGTDGMIIRDSSGNYSPKGTFTLEYTIDGVPQEPITGIKYETAFAWNPTKSGNYEYKIIYNEAAENEYFIIDDFTTTNPVFLTWKFSATGSVDGEYTYGDEVKLEAPATDPAKADKPYYGFVEWVDVNGNTGLSEEELENKEITFNMPDGDVDLDATYKFDFLLCIKYYIQVVVDFFTSFFNSLGTLF